MADIKLNHLQGVVDNSNKNTPTLRKLKVLFRQIFEYAVIHEIISQDKNIASYVNIAGAGNPNKLEREPFSPREINVLWENNDLLNYLINFPHFTGFPKPYISENQPFSLVFALAGQKQGKLF